MSSCCIHDQFKKLDLLNGLWERGNESDIVAIANELRYLLRYDKNADNCAALESDMHLITHKDHKSGRSQPGGNRFAGKPATHPDVARRVGDALAFFEVTRATRKRARSVGR